MSAQSSAVRLTSEIPQFSVVEAVTPVGSAPCAECRGAIVDRYYEADQGIICAACHTLITAAAASASDSGRFPRALGFGTVAAIAGTAIYFGVLAVTGFEVGLVALLVGFIVGKAVRIGARGRGGRRYQWLAAVLTYFAIVSTYVPFVIKGFDNRLGSLLLLATAAPVLEGINHVVGMLIIVVALAQAWRMNRRVDVIMAGPYRVRPASS